MRTIKVFEIGNIVRELSKFYKILCCKGRLKSHSS